MKKVLLSVAIALICVAVIVGGVIGYLYMTNKPSVTFDFAKKNGEITTGASNDIEQATRLARSMVTRYGMNDEFDMVAMETVNNQYLGGDTSLACSEETQKEIDRKVVELVRSQHEKARTILQDNIDKLHELAKFLYEKETITGEEFMNILTAGGEQQ